MVNSLRFVHSVKILIFHCLIKVIPRHRGRIIKLEYNPPEDTPVDTTLFLVGKGINYDTGGADIKYGGSMQGMHRDKS